MSAKVIKLDKHRSRPRKQTQSELAAQTPTPDFYVRGGGSVFLLYPNSNAALEWLNEHIEADAQMFGDAIVVEHRYIRPLVAGIISDGLEVA